MKLQLPKKSRKLLTSLGPFCMRLVSHSVSQTFCFRFFIWLSITHFSQHFTNTETEIYISKLRKLPSRFCIIFPRQTQFQTLLISNFKFSSHTRAWFSPVIAKYTPACPLSIHLRTMRNVNGKHSADPHSAPILSACSKLKLSPSLPSVPSPSNKRPCTALTQWMGFCTTEKVQLTCAVWPEQRKTIMKSDICITLNIRNII